MKTAQFKRSVISQRLAAPRGSCRGVVAATSEPWVCLETDNEVRFCETFCLPMPTPGNPKAEKCTVISYAPGSLGLTSAPQRQVAIGPQLHMGRRYGGTMNPAAYHYGRWGGTNMMASNVGPQARVGVRYGGSAAPIRCPKGTVYSGGQCVDQAIVNPFPYARNQMGLSRGSSNPLGLGRRYPLAGVRMPYGTNTQSIDSNWFVLPGGVGCYWKQGKWVCL